MDISSINNVASAVDAFSNRSLPPPIGADQRALIQAVKSVNSAQLFGQDKELTFIKDRETQRPVIRIINKETGDVVAQIPSENVLLLAGELSAGELSAG